MKRPLISHLHEHVKKVSFVFFLFVSFENINTILLGEPSKKKIFPIKTTFDFLLSRVKNPQNRVSQKILDPLQNRVPSRSVSYKAVSHEVLLYVHLVHFDTTSNWKPRTFFSEKKFHSPIHAHFVFI